MNLTKTAIESIKDGSVAVPKEGVYEASNYHGAMSYRVDHSDKMAYLTINGNWFAASDIKELRKFLKILEQEIK